MKDPRVIVRDAGVDAAVVDDGGTPLLVLRPGQTFSSAVAAASKAMPGLHPDTVRRLVREALPDAVDFGSFGTEPAPDSIDVSAAPARAWATARLPWRAWVALGVAAACGASALGLVVADTVDRPTPPAGAIIAPFPLYAGPLFDVGARYLHTYCTTERDDRLDAECVEPSTGEHYSSRAAVGDGFVIYVFFMPTGRIVVRQSRNARDAVVFSQDAHGAYANLRTVGAYNIYGGRKKAVDEIVSVLQSHLPGASSAAD